MTNPFDAPSIILYGLIAWPIWALVLGWIVAAGLFVHLMRRQKLASTKKEKDHG